MAWILVGEKGARILPPQAGGALASIWRVLLAMIMKVGQQSLAVFISSMFLARLMGVVLDHLDRAEIENWFTMILVNLGGAAIIVALAYGAGWFKSKPWIKKKEAAA